MTRPTFAATPAASDLADRTLQRIDFEERQLGNVESLPMYWLKVDGTGLPHYVNGYLSTDRAHSGRYSFRFDLNGGSLIYRYDPRRLPIRTGAHYRVQSYVQTTPLGHARARMTAYFTDIDLEPIQSTIQHTPLYVADADDAQWKALTLQMSADDPNAAYLCVELELLQPSYYESHALGERSLFPEDIRGSAWFDDVTVVQVPYVELDTPVAGNVFGGSQPLRLIVRLNDRFMDDLSAQLQVTDAKGQPVHQYSGSLDMTSAKSVGPGTRQLTMDLPTFPPGAYHATLTINGRGRFLARKSLDLIRLADDLVLRPDSRFGIIATDLPPDAWAILPDILPQLAAGRVKLALWSHDADVQRMNAGEFDHLLQRFSGKGIVPAGCLLSPPPRMAAKIGGSQWTDLLTAPPQAWQGELSYLIARHATHLDQWQLGADGSADFVTNPAMRGVYDQVYQQFARLMDRPDLAMPWPAWYERNDADNFTPPAAVALSVPTSILPRQIPLYLTDRHSSLRSVVGGHAEPVRVTLSLQSLDAEKYGREVRIRDYVQRIVYAMTAGTQRVDLPLPMSIVKDGRQWVCRPDELYVVTHTLLSALAGASYEGQVPIAEGIDAFLFNRRGMGILVLWNQSNDADVKRLPLRLGRNPVRLDLWGNASPMLQARQADATADGDSLVLNLGPMPVILLDVDGYLARLRASVAVDRPLLESSFKPHHRRITFTNPYPQAISGVLKLVAPPGWTLNPPTMQFNLNPGQTFDQELTLEFPYNSSAGTKILQAGFELNADRASTFTVPVTLRLGLSDVGMRSLALRDGNDLIVQQIISNYGDKPIDYGAFAIVPGQARQERLVIGLAPGQTTIKRYRFANVSLEAGRKVRVGVKQVSGTRILNQELEVQ